jgi:hypothetical protein
MRAKRITTTLLLAIGLTAAMRTYRSPADSMADAATRFLASLSDSQRTVATFPLAADERLRWAFIPNEMWPRKGITIKAMSDAQRALAHALLKSGLSQRGYLTATTIIELENVLQILEGANRRFPRDPEMYWFSVFGTPTAKGAWGWRFEGHHVSLHFTLADGKVIATTPTFLGSNPAEVREGPRRGLRVLGAEEDAGRALVEALTPEQRNAAVVTNVAPNDILTSNKLDIEPLAPQGIRAADLTPPQRALLMRLIDVYTSVMSSDLAATRLAGVRSAGIDNVTFAWAGALERGAKHYYRIQGPTFLVEYDNTQNDGNHIHSVWRDFKSDFGRDLLREHLRSTPH